MRLLGRSERCRGQIERRTAVAAIGCRQVSSVRADHPMPRGPEAPEDPLLGTLPG